MTGLERLQTPAVLAAALLGLAASGVDAVQEPARGAVLPALMVLLGAVLLPLRLADVTAAAQRPRVVLASMALNFVCAPALAWLLGAVLLAGAPDLRLGLLLLLVTPCTDWYLVFTGLARGNTALAAALLPLNLLLQVALLPVYLWALGGGLVPIDVAELVVSVLLVVGVPLAVVVTLRLLGRALGRAVRPRPAPAWLDRVMLGALVVAVAALFAGEGEAVLARPVAAATVLPAVLAFLAIAYAAAAAASRALGLPRPDRATLTMTVMARNSPLALAVAVAAFGDQPLIALALIAGPLVELPTLSVAARRLRGGATHER